MKQQERENNKNKWKRCVQLFIVFLKIGAFTFGGGYAMIPIIHKEVVEKKGWVEDKDILDIVAVAESTPGPIAINAATFVGVQTAGFFGAISATIGVVLPSFLIILMLAFFMNEFDHLPLVRYAFGGIRAGVLALLFKALTTMAKQCPHNTLSFIIIGLSFSAVVFLNISVLLVIIACAFIGLGSILIAAKSKEEKL